MKKDEVLYRPVAVVAIPAIVIVFAGFAFPWSQMSPVANFLELAIFLGAVALCFTPPRLVSLGVFSAIIFAAVVLLGAAALNWQEVTQHSGYSSLRILSRGALMIALVIHLGRSPHSDFAEHPTAVKMASANFLVWAIALTIFEGTEA